MKYLIILLLIISFIFLFLFPRPEYNDCTDFYKNECIDCKVKNMSYLLCSGFCYESDNISLGGCEFDFDRSCEEILKMSPYCVSDSYTMKAGVFGLFDYN